MERLRGESSYKNPQTHSMENARKYLQSVKVALEGEKYKEFLLLLQRFENNRIGVGEMRWELTKLFEGRRELIVGFNKFLPKGCKIEMPDMMQASESFLERIKERFNGGDNRIFDSFVDVLERYKSEKISADEVYVEVDRLFEGHHDLIVEFNSFIPEAFCGLGDFANIVLGYARGISPLDPPCC